MKKPTRLNIGCGKNWMDFKGYVGIDIKSFGQKYVQNLEKAGLRGIEDESVSHIISNHILEHIHQDRIIFVLNECFRVMMKGGRMEIKVPRDGTIEAVADPTHFSRWNEETFRGYICGNRPRHSDYGIKKWKLYKMSTYNSITIEVILEKLQLLAHMSQ